MGLNPSIHGKMGRIGADWPLFFLGFPLDEEEIYVIIKEVEKGIRKRSFPFKYMYWKSSLPGAILLTYRTAFLFLTGTKKKSWWEPGLKNKTCLFSKKGSCHVYRTL